MTAKSTAGIVVELFTGAGTSQPITSLDLGSTYVKAVGATMAAGNLAVVSGTSITVLDTAVFVAGDATTLQGAFSAAVTNQGFTAADMDAGASLKVHSNGTLMCLSNLAISKEALALVQVGTYCDPASTIAGVQTSYGSLTLTGFVDINDAAYKKLVELEITQSDAYIRVTVPDNGHLAFATVVSSITQEFPLVGASSFTATLTLTARPVHAFAI